MLRKRKTRKAALLRTGGSSELQAGINLDWAKIGLVFFTIAVLSFVMCVNLVPDRVRLHLGDVSSREIRANHSVSYIDSVATARLRDEAMEAVRPVYDADEDATNNATRIVKEFFDRIDQVRDSVPDHRARSVSQAAASLQPQFGALFTHTQIVRLLVASPAILQKLRSTTLHLVADAMDREIRDRPDDLEHAQNDLAATAARMVPGEDAGIVSAVAREAMRPNRLYNRRKTESARESHARAVAPVLARLQYGDKIIGKGDTVTQEHIDRFMALGLLHPHLEVGTEVAVCTLAALMVILVTFYIAQTLPALYQDRKRLALLGVIVLLSVFGLKVGASMLGLSFSGGQGGQAGYLGMMTVAAAGMLVSVLLDRNLAVLIVALLAMQSGVIMNHEIRFAIMTLMSSLVGIACVRGVRCRTNIVGVTAALAAANLILVWLLGLLLHDSVSELLTGSGWAVGTAAFAMFLYWFGVLMLEKPFGILTHQTLLEMSAFDRPLLARLCAVAPGTYAHSVMVGTLAEAGAQAIGADALLCRVGGCYHDIGKMNKPEFFIENQRRENIHCRLSPSLSSLIIIAHVREGIELAEKHRLPVEIRDIIAQHHGTTLIRYFYHQALTDCGGTEETPPGLEERFRYPGPKPRTREAAIVMMADSVEAAARSQDKPNQERLQSLIQTIFREKIEDGQLDECDLTFRDLKKISDAFLHVMMAMMHGRIDYPQLPRKASAMEENARPGHRMGESVTISSAEPVEATAMVSSSILDESEVSREITAHLTPNDRVDPTRSYCFPIAEDDALDVSPVISLPRAEPEALYGRLPAERSSAQSADIDSAQSGKPRTKHRRSQTGRG